MFPLEEGKWSEEEIRQQEQDLILHKTKKVIQQEVPKVKDRKKFILDLFCTHKKTIRKGEFIICTKCGYKWKGNAKNKPGTSK